MSAGGDSLDRLRTGAELMCRSLSGDPGAEVRNLRLLGGHAGLTYGFECVCHGAPESLALRLPPAGVRREGTADVLRQARLLAVLGPTDVPVPEVRWAGDDEAYFGRPFMVTRVVAGSTLAVLPDGLPPGGGPAGREADHAVAALATLHRLDWRDVVRDWPASALEDDVLRWDRFLERTADLSMTQDAGELRHRLLARLPAASAVGVRHGDFQWSNLLFDGGRLVAILDWELADVGDVRADAGWLATFTDRPAWAPGFLRLAGLPDVEAITGGYAELRGVTVEELDWFRALAAYKFAVITGFNLRLHRTGRRVDAFWEDLARSIPHLLRRGLELVRAPDGARQPGR